MISTHTQSFFFKTITMPRSKRQRRDSTVIPPSPPTGAASQPQPQPHVPEPDPPNTCYICMESNEGGRLSKCPSCTIWAHKKCVFTNELMRRYGSLESAYANTVNNRTNFQIVCPVGHNFYAMGEGLGRVMPIQSRKLARNRIVGSIEIILLLVAFFICYWLVPVQYYIPLAIPFALGLFALVITIRNFMDEHKYMLTLFPTLFFAVVGLVHIIDAFVSWPKTLLTLALTISILPFESAERALGAAILVPLIWTYDTKMMDWLTPWLVEKAVVFIGSMAVIGLAVSENITTETRYEVVAN